MNLKTLQKTWDKLGEEDHFWAILTQNSKKGNKWSEKDFFATGVKEIEHVMHQIKVLGVHPGRKRALDFGCGVGRLTQALAQHFDNAAGVDIAPSMIRKAEEYNKYPKHCKYYLNTTNNLQMFTDKSFDMIYSNITLQHMKPEYAKKYILEFLRVLAPKGILVFQLPSEPAPTLKGMLIRVLPFPILNLLRKNMEMYGTRSEVVRRFILQNNAKVIAVQENKDAGSGWVSYTYFVTKSTD